jgi:hypothetical protein
MTSGGMFDRPDAGGGDQFVNEQHVGDLLVMQVHDAVRGLQTENGLADCIRADVHVISPEGGGIIRESYLDTYVFGKVLFSQLRQKVGRTVVGILEGQPGVKVQGKNVPYRLNGDVPPPAEQAAVRAMQSRPAPVQQQNGWNTPAPGQQGGPSPWEQQQAPAPQPSPWGQQPAAAPPAPQPGPWGQQPLPAAPPAQQPQPGPWGQQPAAAPPAPWEQPAATPGGAPPF